jgi:ATP-dependent Clp endopeptidase proteolytic subunit ClpP
MDKETKIRKIESGPSMNMLYNFIESSTDIWVLNFEDEDLAYFYEKFTRLENDPGVGVIVIYISSYGGSVHNMCAMRDLIKSCHKPVATICVGKAFSSGAMLLAAGTKGLRFMTENSQCMIHQASSASYGKASEVYNEAINLHYINDLVIKNLSKDMGKKEVLIKNLLKKNINMDLFLNPEECLNLGLVDSIQIPRVAFNPGGMMLAMNPPEEKVKSKPKKKIKTLKKNKRMSQNDTVKT